MITVKLLSRNGQVLPAPESTIIEEGRIIWAEEPAEGALTEKFLYATSLDRRDSPDLLVVEEDGIFAGLPNSFFEVQVLWPDDTTFVVSMNPVFVEYIKDSRVFWNGVQLDCVSISFKEGAFLHKVIYGVGQVGDDGEIVTTTTTTAAPVTTTTTTEEVTTTTTTGE